MDIIVTTPISEIPAAAAEAAEVIASGGGEYFRRFSRRAAPSIGPGERVYYVEDGYIRGFAVVIGTGAVNKGQQCEITGQRWGRGYYVVMAADSWQWMRPMRMQGFQGFRYAWKHFARDEVEIIGGWLDPRPHTLNFETEADLGRDDDASRRPAVKSPARSVCSGQCGMRPACRLTGSNGKDSENGYRDKREDRWTDGFAGG